MAEPRDIGDPRILPFVDGARIDCELTFRFRCPKYWGALETTADPGRRYCSACQRQVHLVTTRQDLVELTRKGACVAVIALEELPAPHQVPERVSLILGLVEPYEP